MPPSDEELIQRMALRDTDAFAAFYERYSGRIMGLLTGMLSSTGDAEDVLQEAFWQAWRQAERYNPARGRPAVWLLIIARTRAVDLLRRRPRQPLPNPTDELPSMESNDQPLEAREEGDRAREALRTLPPEQRNVLTLAFFRGLTHEQIAEYASLPLGTVKSRIRLGMRRLRDILDQDQPAA